MVWSYQNADCSLRKKIIVPFIIIFGTFVWIYYWYFERGYEVVCATHTAFWLYIKYRATTVTAVDKTTVLAWQTQGLVVFVAQMMKLISFGCWHLPQSVCMLVLNCMAWFISMPMFLEMHRSLSVAVVYLCLCVCLVFLGLYWILCTHSAANYLGTSVLCIYAIATCFTYCRIFRIYQQSAHISYFLVQIGIFNGSFNTLYYLFLLGSVLLPRPSDCQQNGPSMCLESGPLWNEMG